MNNNIKGKGVIIIINMAASSGLVKATASFSPRRTQALCWVHGASIAPVISRRVDRQRQQGNHLQIMGSNQSGRDYLYEALDYVAKGKVKVMTETFSLDDIADALRG